MMEILIANFYHLSVSPLAWNLTLFKTAFGKKDVVGDSNMASEIITRGAFALCGVILLPWTMAATVVKLPVAITGMGLALVTSPFRFLYNLATDTKTTPRKLSGQESDGDIGRELMMSTEKSLSL